MSNVDLKELEALLQEEIEGPKEVEAPEKPRYENKDVMRFIRNNNIVSGTEKVPSYVIFYAFGQWVRRHAGTRVWGKEEFFRTFKQHFEQKRTGRQRYYLINKEMTNLDFSQEFYERAKRYEERHNKKRKESAREREISSTRQEQEPTQ